LLIKLKNITFIITKIELFMNDFIINLNFLKFRSLSGAADN
jgi:hypothetical protein